MTGTSPAQLEQAAGRVLGKNVLAAGIFSPKSMIAAGVAGAVGGATAAEIVTHQVTEGIVEEVADSIAGPIAGGAASAAGAYAGIHAAKEVAAAAEGLTPVILVAITDDEFVIMDWHGNSASGTGPTRRLVAFNKEKTTLEFGKIGANRTVTFNDGTKRVAISGALGLLSSGKASKRKVLQILGHPNI